MNNMDDFMLEEFKQKKKHSKIFIAFGFLLLCIIGYIIYASINFYRAETRSVVNFNTNGGNFVTAQTITEDGKINRPEDPTKENYVFVEWQFEGETYNFDGPIDKDITLIAIWKEEKCIVSFDSDGGSEIQPIKITGGASITKPSSPTKSGYNFKYWSSNDKEFDFASRITEDLVLKANWEKIVYTNDSNKVIETNDNDSTSKDKLIDYLKNIGFNCAESCSKTEESEGISFLYNVRFSSNSFKYIIQSSITNVNFTYNYSTNISEGYVNSTKYIYNVTTDTVTSSGIITTGIGATHARASVSAFKSYLTNSGVNREDIIE